jgi:peptidoglycan/LPS O-acetylase OafA/YrhL
MLMLVVGFVALMLIPEPFYQLKFLFWGLPAAAMVAGAVILEEKWGGRMPKWLLEAGDASYALYLSHTFIMPFLGNVMKRMHLTGIPALAAAIVLGLGISFPVALLVHRYVEKPLMNSFKKRRTEPLEKYTAPVTLQAKPAIGG